MTKTEALFKFWSSFGYPVYNEQSVPTGENAPAYPYITYQVVTDSFGEAVPMTASIWDLMRDGYSANSANDQKAEEISRYIGRGGKVLPIDGGAIWITRGSSFAQSMGDPENDAIRRKVLNITAEYISAD